MLMGDPLPQFPRHTRSVFSYDVQPIPAAQGFTQDFHNPESLPFPNPSRPNSDYEINPEIRNNPMIIYPEQGSDQEFHHPESLSLPNPEYCSESRKIQFSEPVLCTVSDHDGTSSSSDRISFSPPTGKTPKEEKEAVDELLVILLECMEEQINTRSKESLLRKFFAEIEKEERIERFIVERLRQSRVKAISDLCGKLPKPQIRSEDEESDFQELNETEGDSSVLMMTRSISESVEELSQKLERFKVRTLDLGGGGGVVQEKESKK